MEEVLMDLGLRLAPTSFCASSLIGFGPLLAFWFWEGWYGRFVPEVMLCMVQILQRARLDVVSLIDQGCCSDVGV